MRTTLLLLVSVVLAGCIPGGPGRPGGTAVLLRGSPGGTGEGGGAAVDTALHPVIAAFAARLAEDVAEDSVGALTAAVIVGDDVVWEGAYGVADREAARPATAATVFRAGSITKVVTAALLMRLVAAGVVGLDDPVAPAVPEIAGLAGFRTGDPPITYRHLASHTAGLEREPSSSRAARGRASGWDRKVTASIPLTEAPWPPGARYHYSNIGYGILGLALERAADRPFEALVAAEVLDPLGMTSSWLGPPRDGDVGLAMGYVNLPDGTVDPRVPRAEHHGRGYKLPSEGLYTTAGDLARLVAGLSGALGDALLDAGARAVLLTDHDPDGDARSGYGLGLQRIRIGDRLIAGHSGTVAGYTSYLAFEPDSRVGVVILRSYNRGATNLAAAAQRLLLELSLVGEGR